MKLSEQLFNISENVINPQLSNELRRISSKAKSLESDLEKANETIRDYEAILNSHGINAGQPTQNKYFPEIITICGSGRFLKEMHEVEEKLTLEGKIVFMIGVNTKDVARTEELQRYKTMLDELHKHKIDISDAIYVVNVNGYIGESTGSEIIHAKEHNKKIYWLMNSLPDPQNK